MEKRLAADNGIEWLTLAVDQASGGSEVVSSVVNKNKGIISGRKLQLFSFLSWKYDTFFFWHNWIKVDFTYQLQIST